MKLLIIFQHIIISLMVISCAQSDPTGKKVLKNKPQSGEIIMRENAQIKAPSRQKQNYVPGQVLVKFKDGVGEHAIQTIKEAVALETIRIVSRPNLFLMRIVNVSSVEEVIERLRNFPEVSYAEPNYRVTVH